MLSKRNIASLSLNFSCFCLILLGMLVPDDGIGAESSPCVALEFTPDGSQLVAASQAGLEILAWPDLIPVATIATECDNVHAIRFSPSGHLLAVAGGNPAEDGQLFVYRWTDKQKVVHWLDDEQLISAGLDYSVQVWDLNTEKCKLQLNGHSRGVTSVCILADKNTAVSAGIDQNLRVWNLAQEKLIRSLSIHSRPVRDLETQPAREGLPMIASVSTDRTVRFWQPTIGRMVRFAKLPAMPLDAAWATDGETIAVACEDGKLHIVDAANVKIVQSHDACQGWAYCVVAHPTDGSFAVGGENGRVVKISR